MTKTTGYAAAHSFSDLTLLSINRKTPKANEVLINILYCGVCHSDAHQVKNEWKNTVYPCMPGHEIIGRVAKCGAKVKKYKVGDLVGVGCMIDSCGECETCKAGTSNIARKVFSPPTMAMQKLPQNQI